MDDRDLGMAAQDSLTKIESLKLAGARRAAPPRVAGVATALLYGVALASPMIRDGAMQAIVIVACVACIASIGYLVRGWRGAVAPEGSRLTVHMHAFLLAGLMATGQIAMKRTGIAAIPASTALAGTILMWLWFERNRRRLLRVA